MNWDLIITVVSALLAGLTFIIIALPLLQRSDKQNHYKKVISDRRRGLYESAKEDLQNPKLASNLSAQESVASKFKIEKVVGKMATDLRAKLAQAGIRDPSAPLKFVIKRIAFPVIFVAFAMLMISGSEKELSNGVTLLILMSLAVFGYALPGILLKNQIQKRQEDVNVTFPDALDMLLVCVQGGISIEQSINRIADEMAEHAPILAEELGLLGAELGLLSDRREAFQGFADRMGSGAAKSFGTAMIQAEKYGTHISTAIRVLADELRAIRMANAETKAASLPPKLTVPMILFFLPALFIVILGPAFIQVGSGG